MPSFRKQGKTRWWVQSFLGVVALFILLTISVEGATLSMQITFKNFAGKGVLTNFPALVKFTTNNTDNYTGFLDTTNGWDLRFWTNSTLDGDELNYEIEAFATNTNSFVWVKIPALTNNLSIWASWGDRTKTNQETYTTNGAVWSEGYTGVYHMAVNGSSVEDSASQGFDGTIQSDPADSIGLIGTAVDFDGDDWVSLPSMGISGDHSVAFEVWVYYQGEGGNGGFLGFGDANNGRACNIRTEGDNQFKYYFHGLDMWSSVVGDISDQWVHVVATYNAATSERWIYYNGTQVGYELMGGNPNFWNTNYRIANTTSGERLTGDIDEARISGVARSSNWVWACWMNQGANHSSFMEYGEPHAFHAGTLIMIR